MDKEIVMYLTTKPNSNNYLERYQAIDPSIVYANIIAHYDLNLPPAQRPARIDTTYNFEGYQIFQLKDATVTTGDLYNLDKARLIAQCDIKNGVATLVNRDFDQSLNADVPQDMTIEANDNGITHSFNITDDAFASGDRRLINHKTYYYMALSYAYNNFVTYADVSFDTTAPHNPSNIGQKKPYLAGRRNVKIYTAIPHIPSPEAGGTAQTSSYGSGPRIVRIEGSGNGSNIIDLTDESENAIVNAPPVQFDPVAGTWTGTARVDQIKYQNGRGPVNIKVIDPLNVPEGQFTLKFTNNPSSAFTVATTARWTLSETSPVVRSWNSDTTITIKSQFANEQIIPELGMSLTIAQVQNPGLDANPDRNSLLESSIAFADPTKDWLSGIVDDDSHSETNWIRAGDFTASANASDPCNSVFNDRFGTGNVAIDANGYYEKIVNGTWGPYRLTADNHNPALTSNCYSTGPAYWVTTTMVQNRFENIANVDVVFTNDRSKWTRVPVFEIGSNPSLNAGGAKPFDLRAAPSVDKTGSSSNTGGGQTQSDYISANGMSWFPGYAVNVETGERLNMAFGENSALVADRGRDMLWNPTASNRSQFFDALFGGQHYIYVFGHNGNARYTTGSTYPNGLNGELKDIPAYDEGKAIMRIMTSVATVSATERSEIWRDAMWVSVPLLSPDFANWTFPYSSGNPLPTDVKVRIRVAKPYKRTLTGVSALNLTNANDTVAAPEWK